MFSIKVEKDRREEPVSHEWGHLQGGEEGDVMGKHTQGHQQCWGCISKAKSWHMGGSYHGFSQFNIPEVTIVFTLL